MGATISTYTDKFYDEKVVSVDTKNFNFWEWAEQEKFLRRNNLWHELKQGNRINPVAALVKGVSENSKINRNIIYLVGGIVSVFYEEALDHQTHKLEEAYEQNQKDSITIDELKAKLAAASKTPTSLNQKSKVNNSAEQTPIIIEDEDITISSMRKGSTSTIDTNDTVERIAIANAESSYMNQHNDQQLNQEVVHMETDKENPKPQPTEEVRKPDESSEKKKPKKKEFTPYIITGHTVLPKLKENIRDIMLYDIPEDWDAEKITEAINKSLGLLIKATLRKQGKYYSVRASVVLRTKKLEELEVYQIWHTELGGKLVCWFPGSWTLEMRKERLSHQAIIKNIPDDLNEEIFCRDADLSLHNQFKSIKIVKDNKGKRKLIGFFEKQADVIAACQHPFTINNVEYNWTRDNYKQRQEKKNAGGKNNKKNNSKKKDLDRKKSKDTSSSKNKSSKKRGGSKQDSVADILAQALAQIMVGQKSKSRNGKKNKTRGSSRS
ncbi:hypothetical protein C1645_832282 [Glomus cerebriforme]|uniref:RRM domain-containing protein n=1 Tax=Glomus cerebriforme TaxID=658196 RepID=A0A397SDV5_9GLOM|nr:hypothetical protein C1645_832282 [Glomus cerebriforme]